MNADSQPNQRVLIYSNIVHHNTKSSDLSRYDPSQSYEGQVSLWECMLYLMLEITNEGVLEILFREMNVEQGSTPQNETRLQKRYNVSIKRHRANSRSSRCLLCSKDNHDCERDSGPPQLQGTIHMLAALGKKNEIPAALNL